MLWQTGWMMNKDKHLLVGNREQEEEYWISISDLMSGLMMIFLLIAIIFMVNVDKEKKRIKEVAIVYQKLKNELYQDLKEEFADDFKKWNAELYKDLTVRFKAPDILFATGSSQLKPEFQTILDDFFPRYVAIITSVQYRESITDVRIEGHTSSIWGAGTSKKDAYFRNMELSQARTRTTLKYVLDLPKVQKNIKWLRKHVTANGLSSSQLIFKENGKEDQERSQRVEFRIITDAEIRIAKILEIE